MTMNIIATSAAPAAIGPYSQAIQAGDMIFTSGQIPLDANGQLVEGGVVEQTHQVFKNLIAVLDEAGASLNDVVKATVFLSDLTQFAQVNEIYAQYFGEHKPARSTVQVARLPRDVQVEIDLIAVKKG